MSGIWLRLMLQSRSQMSKISLAWKRSDLQAGILAIPPESGTIAHNGKESEQSLLPLNLGKRSHLARTAVHSSVGVMFLLRFNLPKLSRSRRLAWNVQGARDSKSFTSGLFRVSTSNMMWNAPFAMELESFQTLPNSRTIAPLAANLSALGRRGAIVINQQSNSSNY